MDLLKEIAVKALSSTECKITFSFNEQALLKLLQDKCYKMLEKIKIIIEKDYIDDFQVVEEIVCVFEELGSDCGSRHDF